MENDEEIPNLIELISDADLAAAEHVMTVLTAHREAFPHKRFRPLRKLGALFSDHYDRLHKEQTESKREKSKRLRRETQKEEQRKRALDRKFRDNARIRAERIGALASLQAQLEGDGPLMIEGGDDDKGEDDDKGDDVEGVLVARGSRFSSPQPCYVCKRFYFERHEFYDCLCPQCASFNYGKRMRMVPLTGKVVLITGARIKIGFEAALRLLRCGAHVHVTTRFPIDAVGRYAQVEDYESFRDRLTVHGLDLRDLRAVERFADAFCALVPELHALVNNAAQTVRRPPAFYAHLLAGESRDALQQLPEAVAATLDGRSWHDESIAQHALPASRASIVIEAEGDQNMDTDVAATDLTRVAPMSQSAMMTQIALMDGDHDTESFPEGLVDGDGQQVDLRRKNSWEMLLHEVPVTEAMETHCINALAPMVLCGRLRRILAAGAERGVAESDNEGDHYSYVVNVSAMEGKFYRFKTAKHAHTNMAKAALNMMTRTAASDYQKSRILMNAVDTGWITDEHPTYKAMERFVEGFQTPIDEIDAAMRIIDPIMIGVGGVQEEAEFFPVERFAHGLFIKDYRKSEW